jgi:predicted  nucleic acid-binding Zn-ribbon protein
VNDLSCQNETQIREGYIEEIVALEAQIGDESYAEIALERSRADAAEKRAAKSEAERDQLRQQAEKLEHDFAGAKGAFDSMAEASAREIGELRQQVEGLLEAVDAHNLERSATSTPQKFSRDSALYAAADQVRKELGE